MQPADYPPLIKLLYDWQALAAGLLALGAAMVAALPVWRQIKLLKVQSAVMAREALLTRLSVIESRRNATSDRIGGTTALFVGLREPYEDEDQPLHTAHQQSSLDGASIDDARKILMGDVEALAQCLYRIHAPDSNDLSGPDFNMTESEIQEVEKDAARAVEELEPKIAALRKSAGALNATFADTLQELRKRIVRLDALVGD